MLFPFTFVVESGWKVFVCIYVHKYRMDEFLELVKYGYRKLTSFRVLQSRKWRSQNSEKIP